MVFDLEERLLQLAKDVVSHESPESSLTGRRFEAPNTRRSLKPDERRADQRASQATETLASDQRGPRAVMREKQLIDGPGSPNIDDRVWRRAEGAQAATASPLPPAVANRIGTALGHDVSDVHVHTDATADQICRHAHAEVVARGRDVFFRRGVPMPGTVRGDAMLSRAVEQLTVDGRTADKDKPMRRFMDNEPSGGRLEAPTQDAERSGWGLLELVGTALGAAEAFDSQSDEPEAVQHAITDDDKAKLASDVEQPEAEADRQDVVSEDSAELSAGEVNADLDAEPAELASREQNLRDVADAAREQQGAKEQLPDNPEVEQQRRSLASMAAMAGALANDVRETRTAAERRKSLFPGLAQGDRDETQSVAAELALDSPLHVAGHYDARFRGAEEDRGPDDVAVDDHRLLMEVDVDDAAQRFENDAFEADMRTTVDRVTEMVELELQDRLNGVTGPERERLMADVAAVTPQLPEVIERQVREASEANADQEQEELQLELEAQQSESPESAADEAADGTFAFGARIDLRTGQVVVTTNDSLPTSIDAGPSAPGPATTSGDGGAGGSSGGAGSPGGGAAPSA